MRDAIPPVVEAYDRFEALCADDGTVCGSFTIADCCVGPGLWRTSRQPLPTERWPRLVAIREAVAARPSFLAADPVE